ncbi:hypothetical protein [Bifidobacterium thermophilum]|uniref:hypothetical protein n=1 Tax=Bifidobacterium thermophilum TaxID=33905 RepID=UPI000C710C63|nr:hypothetical protein [Bifidobacterium thermophilum]
MSFFDDGDSNRREPQTPTVDDVQSEPQEPQEPQESPLWDLVPLCWFVLALLLFVVVMENWSAIIGG